MPRRNLNESLPSARVFLQSQAVERRQQARRLPIQQSTLDLAADIDDRRLGLGRRLDDWLRRQAAA